MCSIETHTFYSNTALTHSTGFGNSFFQYCSFVNNLWQENLKRSCRRGQKRSLLGHVKAVEAPFGLRLPFCSFLSHFYAYFFFPRSSLCIYFPSVSPLLFRQLSSSSLRVRRTDKLFHKWLAVPTRTCLLKVYTGRKDEKSINAMKEMGG